MKTNLYLLLLSVLLSGCVYVKYHNYAPVSQPEAELAINALKGDTLVVIVPTHQEKVRILNSAKNKARGKSKKNRANQKLVNLYADRQLETEALINAFEQHYTFSHVLYMPDSLVSQFESGIGGDYFIDHTTYRINPEITYSNQSPIKLLKQFEQEWQIKVNNRIIPNPFPNYYLYRNGLYGFLGTETYDRMYERVATVFQRRFEAFHLAPTSRLTH